MLRFKIYQNLNHIFLLLFFLSFIFQFLFWLFKTEQIKPDVYIVPPLVSLNAVKALSLGDEQFYFRVLGLRIENAGDTFGRISPLKNYDYSKLYHWFKILDSLDNKSVYIPFLASQYYSNTQKTEDNKYLVQYLDEFSSRDLGKYWFWEFQAFEIANHKLKDYSWALNLANKTSKAVSQNKSAPQWLSELPALVYVKLGEDCEAFLLINKILQDDKTGIRKIKPEEADFLNNFIKTRLGKMKKENFDLRKCQK